MIINKVTSVSQEKNLASVTAISSVPFLKPKRVPFIVLLLSPYLFFFFIFLSFILNPFMQSHLCNKKKKKKSKREARHFNHIFLDNEMSYRKKRFRK